MKWTFVAKYPSYVLLLLGLTWGSGADGQKTQADSISEFRQRILSQKIIRDKYLKDSLKTTDTIIFSAVTECSRALSIISKNTGTTQTEIFYPKNPVLREKSLFIINSGFVSNRYFYSKNGKLECVINYDSSTFTATQKFHYYRILYRAKAFADALIIATYGKPFFDRYVRWNPDQSEVLYANGLNVTWFINTPYEPRHFEMHYAIAGDSSEKYNDDIIISFNRRFQLTKTVGLEPNHYGHTLYVSSARALDIAFFCRPKPTQWNAALVWDDRFVFQLWIERKKSDAPNWKYYDVYEFDPWTGRFLQTFNADGRFPPSNSIAFTAPE